MEFWVARNPDNSFHVVSFDIEGGWFCTCSDFLFRHRECKHIKRIKMEYKEENK